MDEKDKFDGTEKIEEEEEKVYIARHAKKDEEDRFADIENFDVDNTETVENKEVEKIQNDVPNNEPAIDSAENFDVHSDNYGDDFDCQSIASKNHIPSDNPKKATEITVTVLTLKRVRTDTNLSADNRIMTTIMRIMQIRTIIRESRKSRKKRKNKSRKTVRRLWYA